MKSIFETSDSEEPNSMDTDGYSPIWPYIPVD